jgi:hypothetical protein
VCDRPDVNKNINKMTVIIPINADVYAGTCAMYSEGFSYSMCPVTMDTAPGATYRELVAHEAGGHGFPKLADEYIYYDQTYPANWKEESLAWKELGHLANIDFYADISKTTWRGFAGSSKYSMVSTYQGADLYSRGVWRPEYNSCMNDNVLYFNAPSRHAIVRRIKSLSGFDSDYTVAEFMAEDIVPAYPSTRTRSSVVPFRPLGRPLFRD